MVDYSNRELLVAIARARAEFTALSEAAKRGVRVRNEKNGVVRTLDSRTGTKLRLDKTQYANFIDLVVRNGLRG